VSGYASDLALKEVKDTCVEEIKMRLEELGEELTSKQLDYVKLAVLEASNDFVKEIRQKCDYIVDSTLVSVRQAENAPVSWNPKDVQHLFDDWQRRFEGPRLAQEASSLVSLTKHVDRLNSEMEGKLDRKLDRKIIASMESRLKSSEIIGEHGNHFLLSLFPAQIIFGRRENSRGDEGACRSSNKKY
jgi:hypothetical protein